MSYHITLLYYFILHYYYIILHKRPLSQRRAWLDHPHLPCICTLYICICIYIYIYTHTYIYIRGNLTTKRKRRLCLPAIVGVPTRPVDVCRGLCGGKIGLGLAIPHAWLCVPQFSHTVSPILCHPAFKLISIHMCCSFAC